MPRRCWCGQDALEPFCDDYARCPDCQTLICTSGEPASVKDFYNWDYFHHDQTRRGVPPIEVRARADLFDRCVYWLNDLSRFKLPPARVLELGSAHGGFVALLRQAGYDAIGLDLCPSIVELARKTFDVPMLTGPLEGQASLQPASFDAIVMMDVIEHLPDPKSTIQHCLRLLKPDGVVFIQTPCYPASRSFADLSAAKHRFLAHLSPGEHLNLFSRESLAKLLEQAGAGHAEFVPAIYGFYDMSCLAGRLPLIQTAQAARDEAFSRTVGARFVQALLDGEARYRDLLAKHRQLLSQRGRSAAQTAAAA